MYKRKPSNFLVPFVLCILLVTVLVVYFFRPIRPVVETIVTVPTGYGISQTGELLKEEGIITSPLMFSILGRINNSSVKAGSYLFDEPTTLIGALSRLEHGEYGDVYTQFTIPEGSTNEFIARLVSEKFEHIAYEDFKVLIEEKEGFLFPDTYSVLPDIDAEGLVTLLEENFQFRTAIVQEAAIRSSRSFEDIVTMASLIEREAGDDPIEQKTVAGILWKRIDRGIPLQVDAPFLYTQGKTSAQLSLSDLRRDGPYNTYTRQGLTPTPIGNPGLASLDAALNPLDSLYLFYLHDTTGGIHYAIDHDGHVRNKQRYL